MRSRFPFHSGGVGVEVCSLGVALPLATVRNRRCEDAKPLPLGHVRFAWQAHVMLVVLHTPLVVVHRGFKSSQKREKVRDFCVARFSAARVIEGRI